jgi:hypothetical protein
MGESAPYAMLENVSTLSTAKQLEATHIEVPGTCSPVRANYSDSVGLFQFFLLSSLSMIIGKQKTRHNVHNSF